MSNIKKFTPQSLDFLSEGKAWVEKATTVDEAKEIKSRAETLRVYVKQTKQGLEVQNKCAEVRIRAERRIGEMLQETMNNKERQGQGGNRKSKSNDGTLKTLDDLGVKKNESSRYQRIADIPEEAFEEKINEINDKHQELTTALFLSLYKHTSKDQREKDEVTEFKLFLHKARMRAESLSEQFGDILEKKENLRSADIWNSDDRKDLHRVIGNLLLDSAEKLIEELDSIQEQYKAMESKKATAKSAVPKQPTSAEKAIRKSKSKKVIDTVVVSEAQAS